MPYLPKVSFVLLSFFLLFCVSCSESRNKIVATTEKIEPVTDIEYAQEIPQVYECGCGCSARIPIIEDDLVLPEEEEQIADDNDNLESPAEILYENLDDVTSEDEVYMVVGIMPEFPGGEEKLLKYLKNAIEYPKSAQNDGVSGRVYVQFVIQKDGSVADIKVIKSYARHDLEEACLRAVASMPKWTPGKQDGKTVKVKYILPVYFVLDEDSVSISKKEMKRLNRESLNSIATTSQEATTLVEIEKKFWLTVYPNPVSENCFLQVSEPVEGLKYYIIASNGQTVLTGDMANTKEQISVRDLVNGVYVVKVMSSESAISATSRVVVQH